MIEVTLRVWVTAEDDDAADALIDILRRSGDLRAGLVVIEQSRRVVGGE